MKFLYYCIIVIPGRQASFLIIETLKKFGNFFFLKLEILEDKFYVTF